MTTANNRYMQHVLRICRCISFNKINVDQGLIRIPIFVWIAVYGSRRRVQVEVDVRYATITTPACPLAYAVEGGILK